MAKTREIVSIDIGSDTVKGMVVAFEDDIYKALGYSSLKTRGIDGGEIKDVVALGEVVATTVENLEEQVGKRLNGEFLISSSCGNFTLKEMSEEIIITDKDEREITEDDQTLLTDNLLNHLSSEESISFHLFVKRYIIDDKKIVVNPVGMKAKKLTAIYTIVLGDENYKNVVEYGTKDIVEDAEHYISFISTGEAVLSSFEKDSGVLLVDLGYNNTNVVLYYAGSPVKFQRINIAGKHIIKDIAIVLKTSLSEAERLLRTYGLAHYRDVEPTPIEYKALDGKNIQKTTRETLAKIIYARLREILSEVREIYKNVLRTYPEFGEIGIPGGIVLTGGIASLPKITDLASEIFKTYVRVGTLQQQELFSFEEFEEKIILQPSNSVLFGNILVYEKESSIVREHAFQTKVPKKSAGFSKIMESFKKLFEGGK